jgi:hypothetical protein
MKQIQPTKRICLTLQPIVWAYVKKWTRILNHMVENKGTGTRIREDQVIAAIITIATIDGCEQFDRLQEQQLSDRLESLGLLGPICPETAVCSNSFTTNSRECSTPEGTIP